MRPSSALCASRAAATAHAAVRCATNSEGRACCGGSSPRERTSTPARSGIAAPWPPPPPGAARRGRRRRRGRGRRGRARRSPRSTCTPARVSIAASAAPSPPAPMTAARRSGGRPPSHSHWSITLRPMRSVTAAAELELEALDPRERRAGRRSGCGPCAGGTASRCARFSVPITATGTTGAPVSSARRPTPRFGRPSAPGRMRVPSANITTASPRSRIAFAVASMSWSPPPRTRGTRRASSGSRRRRGT